MSISTDVRFPFPSVERNLPETVSSSLYSVIYRRSGSSTVEDIHAIARDIVARMDNIDGINHYSDLSSHPNAIADILAITNEYTINTPTNFHTDNNTNDGITDDSITTDNHETIDNSISIGSLQYTSGYAIRTNNESTDIDGRDIAVIHELRNSISPHVVGRPIYDNENYDNIYVNSTVKYSIVECICDTIFSFLFCCMTCSRLPS